MPTVLETTIGGTSPDWSTIAGWEADTGYALTTADELCRGKMRAVDFAEAVVIFGATTDSTRYRELTFDTGARYDPAADTGAKVTGSGNSSCIQLAEVYARIVGFCAEYSGNGSNHAIAAASTSTVDSITVIDNCSGTGSAHGINAGNSYTVVNCLFYRVAAGTNGFANGINFPGFGTSTAFNCTVYNARVSGIAGTRNNTNCVVTDSGTSDFAGSPTGDYNISGDTTANGTNNIHSEVDTDLWTDPSAGDFTLKSGSAAIDFATATGIPSTDIIGTTRTTTHDCGCYDEASTASSGTTGTAASTSPGSESSATGVITSYGTGASTSPGSESSATGVITSYGTAASTSPGSESAGIGVTTTSATGASTSPGSESAGTGVITSYGTGASTSPGSESAGVGVTSISATGASTSPGSESTGTGVVTSYGTATSTSPGSESAGTGTVSSAISATGASTSPSSESAGTGTAGNPVGTAASTSPGSSSAGLAEAGIEELVPISEIQIGAPPRELAKLVWWLENLKKHVVRLQHEVSENMEILDDRTS